MPSSACKKCDLRSEEHTSELQSHDNLVCRLLLEKIRSDRKSTRLNSSHTIMSYAVFCLQQKTGGLRISMDHTNWTSKAENRTARLPQASHSLGPDLLVKRFFFE